MKKQYRSAEDIMNMERLGMSKMVSKLDKMRKMMKSNNQYTQSPLYKTMDLIARGLTQ